MGIYTQWPHLTERLFPGFTVFCSSYSPVLPTSMPGLEEGRAGRALLPKGLVVSATQGRPEGGDCAGIWVGAAPATRLMPLGLGRGQEQTFRLISLHLQNSSPQGNGPQTPGLGTRDRGS